MKNKRIIFSILILLLSLFSIKTTAYALSEEDIPKLKSFNLTTTELNEGEKLYYNIDFEGKVMFIGLWAKETTTNEVFYITTSELNNKYFDLGKQNGNTYHGPGNFQVTQLTFGLDGGIYYYKSEDCNSSSCGEYDFSNIKFTIKEKTNEELPIYDYTLSIKTKEAHIGEKIYVDFGSPQAFNGKEITPKPLSNVLLSFSGDNGSAMNVYVKSLDNEPYFIIPSTTSTGKYTIDYGYLTFTDGTSERYKNIAGKVFSYEGTFEVVEKSIDTTKYVFNNENYNEEVQAELQKLDNNAVITIDANKVPIVDKSIFEFIQATNRSLLVEYQNSTWVFNGKDILNPKAIEVSTKLEDLFTSDEADENLKNKITSKAIMLKFNNNGDLPGKVLIKLDGTEVEKYVDEGLLYVYYYDEENDELVKVAMEVQKNNGFYEFYINHNSKYILTATEIAKENTSDSNQYLQLNSNDNLIKAKDNTNKILYISIGIITFLLLIITLLLLKNKSRENNTIEN